MIHVIMLCSLRIKAWRGRSVMNMTFLWFTSALIIFPRMLWLSNRYFNQVLVSVSNIVYGIMSGYQVKIITRSYIVGYETDTENDVPLWYMISNPGASFYINQLLMIIAVYLDMKGYFSGPLAIANVFKGCIFIAARPCMLFLRWRPHFVLIHASA